MGLQKGQTNSGSFKKGNIAWNKDLKDCISEDGKRRISEGVKKYIKERRIISNETREKLRKLQLGLHRSEKTKMKISLSLMGNKRSYNKKRSLETIEKFRKISNENYKKYPEIKEKISKKVKLNFINHPEIIESQKESLRRTYREHPEIIQKIKEARRKQVLPIKDTSIEVKIQNFLKQLNIEFFTHQYINIKHSYQCDILIPIQDKINQKTIIECDGDYWHSYPTGNNIDYIRTKELLEKGFKVLRLWEREIKFMDLNKFKIILTGNYGAFTVEI
jgi:G:T-mismatch repair DNA endonuclease (very short patch repair protein)